MVQGRFWRQNKSTGSVRNKKLLGGKDLLAACSV